MLLDLTGFFFLLTLSPSPYFPINPIILYVIVLVVFTSISIILQAFS